MVQCQIAVLEPAVGQPVPERETACSDLARTRQTGPALRVAVDHRDLADGARPSKRQLAAWGAVTESRSATFAGDFPFEGSNSDKFLAADQVLPEPTQTDSKS